MTGCFITATGTGIGKTLLTAALAWQLRAKGEKVRALKPVISGFDPRCPESSDSFMLLSAQGLSPASLDAVSPWRFAAPLSPDMAAEDEGSAIALDRLAAFCRQEREDGTLLIEGVGGVMTPLGGPHTVLDWMRALKLPVLLVAGSYLGTLSHALTSARVILSAGLALHAVVISESETSPVPLARTRDTLRRFLPESTLLATIARLDSSTELWKDVPDVTHLIPS